MLKKECCLCIESDNEAMARGYIVVTELTTLYELPLRANTYRVTIKTAVDPKACILIGDEFVYIKDVVDTMVPWPKHIVFLSTAKLKIILL